MSGVQIQLVCYISVLILLLSCSQPVQQEAGESAYRNQLGRDSTAQWNYLVYMAADNNLERFAIQNIMDMKEVGSTEDVNILVLLDRSPGYDKTNGDWTDTRLLYITKEGSLNDDIVKEYGELDMTNPSTLLDFLTLANTHYPARNTALVLWSHGTGVYPEGAFLQPPLLPDDGTGTTIPAATNSKRGVVHDYSTGYLAKITIQSLDEILQKHRKATGKPLQLLQFDACLMQMLETVWQLEHEATYIVGSQANVPGTGSNYKAILSHLTKTPDITDREFALVSVESFKEFYSNTVTSISYSAMATESLPSFRITFTQWTDSLSNASMEERAAVQSLRQSCTSYDIVYTEYIDLREITNAILNTPSLSPSIRLFSQELVTQLEHLVICNNATNRFQGKLQGLGICWPHTQEQYEFYTMDSATVPPLRMHRETTFPQLICQLLASTAASEPSAASAAPNPGILPL